MESSTATYAATAAFSDGTTQNVTAGASWSENSDFASIAGGVLTTHAVSSDQRVTLAVPTSRAASPDGVADGHDAQRADVTGRTRSASPRTRARRPA